MLMKIRKKFAKSFFSQRRPIANAFMHEELMELFIDCDTALPSSHERI